MVHCPDIGTSSFNSLRFDASHTCPLDQQLLDSIWPEDDRVSLHGKDALTSTAKLIHNTLTRQNVRSDLLAQCRLRIVSGTDLDVRMGHLDLVDSAVDADQILLVRRQLFWRDGQAEAVA